MKVLALEAGPEAGPAFLGTVLCQTVTQGPASKKVVVPKGRRIGEDDLAALRSVERQPVRVIRLEDGDLHEDEAAVRLARAIAGPGLTLRGPVQSRMDLLAAGRGILVLDRAGLTTLNALPDVAVFTAVPYLPVEVGQVVAGVKVIPVVAAEATVSEAERLARGRGALVQVKKFRRRAVGVVAADRATSRIRPRFEDALRRKVDWFGASLVGIRYTNPEVDSVKSAMRDVLAGGAEILITAGSRSADPLDPLVVAVGELGGTIVSRGAPTHPGSFFWLGYLGECAIFGVPSCGFYAEATIVDLLLSRVMAGERITRSHIAELGVGGLFGPATRSLFPDYEAVPTGRWAVPPDPGPARAPSMD